MRQTADVKSLTALQDARAALGEFRDVVKIALGEAMSDAQRTQFWISSEGKLRWRAEQKRRHEKLNQAKSELARAELAAMNSNVSTREEKKLVQRRKHELEEAERRLVAIRRWETLLEREITIFKGQLQALGRAVEGDLPKADAKLVRMIDSLEKYVRIPVNNPHKAAERAPVKDDRTPAEEDPKEA